LRAFFFCGYLGTDSPAEIRMTDPKSLLYLGHARTEEQRQHMSELAAEGICPFCDEHLEREHREPIEARGTWWSVTKNDHPYKGARLHYLLIYRSHATTLAELPLEAFTELGAHLQWLEQTHDLPGGTFFMRFGDMPHTGATIAHLHAHVVVGASAGESTEKLKVSVGYKVKE
jgi:ATP adenylyltransferase